MKNARKHIYDMWIFWNIYNVTQMKLAHQYRIPKKEVSYIVNARNKSDAWKRYKKIFLSV